MHQRALKPVTRPTCTQYNIWVLIRSVYALAGPRVGMSESRGIRAWICVCLYKPLHIRVRLCVCSLVDVNWWHNFFGDVILWVVHHCGLSCCLLPSAAVKSSNSSSPTALVGCRRHASNPTRNLTARQMAGREFADGNGPIPSGWMPRLAMYNVQLALGEKNGVWSAR